MFTSQITTIESEIQALIEKKNQYCTLEKQVESVKEALNQIEQTAQGLDSDTMPQVFTALGLPVATITDVQTPQQAQQLEQQKQQNHQLEQAKEQSQQVQAQVVVQQEEIASLKQKLLAAERKAQASKEQQEAIERHVISEKEMLEEQKIAYVEHMKDLEDTAAQFVFPSDIESFIHTGKFEFDLESDLIEVVEFLDKTPDWCAKARVEYLWSVSCSLVRENLGVHLPAYLLWIWRECAAAETQIETQTVNQLEGIPSSEEDFEPDYQKLFQLQSGQYLQPHEKPVAGENGEQPLDQWVNLVEDDEDDFPDEFEEGEEGNEGEYKLGLDEEDEDCWGEGWIKEKNNEWIKADNTQPELKFGDRVQIRSGEVCTIENMEYIGIMAYFTLKLPNGKTQSGFRACDFQRVSTQEPVAGELGELEEAQASETASEPVEVVISLSTVESPVAEVKPEVVQNQATKTEAVPKVGSWVKVPDGRNGQVLYFTTTLAGEENVAVEVTPLKGKRKKVEQFPLDKVTVIIAEVTDPPIAKDKYIDRQCECPDGRTGRVVKTKKKGRFVELEVSFSDGTKQEYDLNSLWLLPEKAASSQAA